MSEAAAEVPPLELQLRRPAFWTWPALTALLALLAVPAGMVFGLHHAQPATFSVGDGLGFFALCSLASVGLVALVRALTRPDVVPPLRVYATHLLVPRSAGSKETDRVDPADIVSLQLVGSGRGRLLLLETSQRVHGYPLRSFVEPSAVAPYLAEVRGRLGELADGRELLARIDRREAEGRTVRASRPGVTQVLVVSLAVVFTITWVADATSRPFGLVRYGGNAPALVAAGQWFRLFAANFLHANLLHLWLNALSLLGLGSLLERLIGHWRLTWVYLLSALGGSVASALVARAAYSVGASTAIFGLLGSLGAVQWRWGRELPAEYRRPRRWWLNILGLNALLPLLVPQIDIAAHLGGLLSGVGATFLACRKRGSEPLHRQAPRWLRVGSLCLCLCFVVALGQAIVYASAPHPYDQTRVEAAFGEARRDPTALNEIAWRIATDPNSTPVELELALHAADRAQAFAPTRANIADTRATLHYRMGNLERAITLERDLVRHAPKPFHSSQLARFLNARLARQGPLAIGPAADVGAFELRAAVVDGLLPARLLLLRVEHAYPAGAELWALVKHDDATPEGVLRIVLGPSDRSREVQFVPSGPPLPARGGVRFEIAFTDTTGCAPCPPETVQSDYLPADPASFELP